MPHRKPKTPFVTTDGIILKRDKVLLVKRNPPPFSGYWTLPGGHVDYGETVETAIKREMREELGVEVKIKKIIGVYSDPKRDPRYHAISVIYLLGKGKGKIKLDWESSEYKYFPLNKPPKRIGFDHKKVLKNLKRNLKSLKKETKKGRG